jgi:ABC-type multidrug transport system fused ATPase/permease subunit
LKKIDIYEKANALLSDVILNYKTVFSFGDQNTERIFEKFRILMETPLNKKINDCHMNGFAFGYSSAVRIIFTGIVFYLGTIVINKWHFKTEDVFLGINIMMSSVMGVGVAFSNVPSV